MGGIYIHIPFCRQACRYCDFFFTVSLKHEDELINALLLEVKYRSAENRNQPMGSIYLGGGTPSLLSAGNLEKIMQALRHNYRISADAEVTMECNPDDLNKERLDEFRSVGFNRLSIGIQSFADHELKLMRRSHSAIQAASSVEASWAAGFENITVDLIYGIPGQTLEGWTENILRALALPVSHLSAYHLTFEKGTVFDHWRKKGRISPVPEEQSEGMYRILREKMLESGFEHYEISNFARSGFRSRHNQLYWSGEPYLGLGPSAHSYDGTHRSWNVASLKGYMDAVSEDRARETETLSVRERYHDYLITSLRTSKGVERKYILKQFGRETSDYFEREASHFVSEGSLRAEGERLYIDPERWLLADQIISRLFLE